MGYSRGVFSPPAPASMPHTNQLGCASHMQHLSPEPATLFSPAALLALLHRALIGHREQPEGDSHAHHPAHAGAAGCSRSCQVSHPGPRRRPQKHMYDGLPWRCLPPTRPHALSGCMMPGPGVSFGPTRSPASHQRDPTDPAQQRGCPATQPLRRCRVPCKPRWRDPRYFWWCNAAEC